MNLNGIEQSRAWTSVSDPSAKGCEVDPTESGCFSDPHFDSIELYDRIFPNREHFLDGVPALHLLPCPAVVDPEFLARLSKCNDLPIKRDHQSFTGRWKWSFSSFIYPTGKTALSDAKAESCVSRGQRDAVDFNKDTFTGVLALEVLWYPLAVLFAVISIHFHSLDRVSSGTDPHVGNELFVRTPDYTDSSSSVIVILPVSLVSTTTNHIPPNPFCSPFKIIHGSDPLHQVG